MNDPFREALRSVLFDREEHAKMPSDEWQDELARDESAREFYEHWLDSQTEEKP